MAAETSISSDAKKKTWAQAGKIFIAFAGAVLLCWLFIQSAYSSSLSSNPAANPSGSPLNDPNQELFPQPSASGLVISKTHSADFTIGSGGGTFSLFVRNVSTATITGTISVIDKLPAGLTYLLGSGVGITCAPSGQLVTCPISNTAGLPPANSYIINLSVNVDPSAPLSVTNIMTATHGSEVLTASDRVTIKSVDLAVTKRASPVTPKVGDAVSFSVGVTNRGPYTATNVVLTDTVDTNLTLNTFGATLGTYSSSTGRWSIGTLRSNQTVTLTLGTIVKPNTYGLTITDATNGLSSTPVDYNPANNTAAATIQVGFITVSKDDNRTTLTANQTYAYTITVENKGPTVLSSYRITDTLSSYLTLISDTMGVTRQNPGSGDIYVWDITEDLAAGHGKDYSVQVKVDSTLPAASTSIVNTVQVGQSSPTSPIVSDSDTDTASGTRNVTISNSVSPTSVQTGKSTTYSIRVSNSGSAAVTDVTVLDTFSTYVDIDSVKTTKGTHDTSSRTVTVDVGTLNAGQSATITVVVKVNNTATTNLTVSNTATLTYKFGTTTYTSGATVSFSILRTTTLPGTGGIELERPAKPQSSGINLIAWLSASFLGLLGLISLILGLIAKIQRSEWAGWVIRMGVMFSFAAVMFGMVAWGLAQFAGVGSQTLGTAMLKSAQKTRLTQGFVQDPPWVGSNQANEPEVLPDFPVPEPTQTAPDENGKPPDTSPVNRIALPSIGVDTVVKYVPYDGDTWLIAGLKQEIAWMGDTSWPGLGGNTGLAGHVSLRDGRDGPFRYLSELVPDDIIILYTDENIYTYKVRETRVVSDSDMTVIQPTQNPQITLITCTNWDATSGSYLDRLVVYADLTSVTPAAGATQGN